MLAFLLLGAVYSAHAYIYSYGPGYYDGVDDWGLDDDWSSEVPSTAVYADSFRSPRSKGKKGGWGWPQGGWWYGPVHHHGGWGGWGHGGGHHGGHHGGGYGGGGFGGYGGGGFGGGGYGGGHHGGHGKKGKGGHGGWGGWQPWVEHFDHPKQVFHHHPPTVFVGGPPKVIHQKGWGWGHGGGHGGGHHGGWGGW